MEKMEKVYEGKAHIVFIDVWENRDQAQRFKISAIPTQLFFNEKGEEVYRHVGFLDEKSARQFFIQPFLRLACF